MTYLTYVELAVNYKPFGFSICIAVNPPLPHIARHAADFFFFFLRLSGKVLYQSPSNFILLVWACRSSFFFFFPSLELANLLAIPPTFLSHPPI